MWFAIIGAIVWAIAPLLAVSLENALLPVAIAIAVSLGFGALWFRLGKLQRQFYEGRHIPPRNLPEKIRP
ncbi:hypothetical protein [Argonema antarcticum]|uniref:hypothetical protein n=1 Tax=Argonema antarcticum TaxID=2942763 RepID=UPI0020110287|nr:hypothetical protein [Argonema antarcticum]MCL1475719.1 hypothetical protein [Argonema antarcticum A004/B2]